MAILIGTATGDAFGLIEDSNYNYGLEDDCVVGLDGWDTIKTGAGNDFLDGGDGTTATRMVTGTTRSSAGLATMRFRSMPITTSTMERGATILCGSI